MPMYDYRCEGCGDTFEAIVSSSTSTDPVPCPACGETHTARKLISAFAVGASRSPAPRMAAPPCGSCDDPRGPGACSMN